MEKNGKYVGTFSGNKEGIIFVPLLKECARKKDLQKGRSLHADILKKGLLNKSPYLGSSLVNMYAKCGALAKAEEVLEQLPSRDVVSWSALIAGYAQLDQGHKALTCAEHMQREGFSPDAVTFTSMLKACGGMKAVAMGRKIHEEIVNKGLLGEDIILNNALVDMYAKCGDLVKAQQVLCELPIRDVASWNSLIAGYAQHAQSEDALKCFEWMQNDGISPDVVTFICVMKSCGEIKAITKGMEIHKEIMRRGLLENHVELGNTLVDMYAKWGLLERAQYILRELPVRDVVSWNSLISGYALNGLNEEALTCFDQMQQDGISPDAITLTCILSVCGSIRLIEKGKEVHHEIINKHFLGKYATLGNSLVDMYAKCGALSEARQVFDTLTVQDVSSWNSLITGYVQNGQDKNALDCFRGMQNDGLHPDVVTYTLILKACGSMGEIHMGKQIHNEIIGAELLQKHIMLGNALVDMYVKCGAVEHAQDIFDQLPVRDIVSWNALIAGYVEHGYCEHAIRCFEWMKSDGHSPDTITFSFVLKSCGKMKDLEKGINVHVDILESGLQCTCQIGRALVTMYARCGAFERAEQVLRELSVEDVGSWSALIGEYAEHGQGQKALDCFLRMQKEGILPDSITFICILKICGNIQAITKGKQIHDEITCKGLLAKSIMLGNALIDMYSKCDELENAQSVFNGLLVRDVISWNTMIAGYVQQRQDKNALSCFEHMQNDGFSPNIVTFIHVTKACGSMSAFDKGKQIHKDVVSEGLLSESIELGNALVDMYVRCGEIQEAHDVLDELPLRDIISWSVLISGYIQKGHYEDAFIMFEHMKNEGIHPNTGIFTCILKASGNTGAIIKGRQIHDELLKTGLLKTDINLGNALIDMYTKCGDLANARQVLEELPKRDVVSWSTLIAGYAQQDRGEDALKCFERMKNDGVLPNSVTYTCILKACGSIGAVDKAKEIHEMVMRMGSFEKDAILGTALVDMYAKCGSIEKSQQVFDILLIRSAISWNALISGYLQQGLCEDALSCFQQMRIEGLLPDAITSLYVLTAFSHLGLIDQGRMYLVNMSREYGITPDIQHQTCIVDSLACAGMFDEAMSVIMEMPSFDYPFWCALMGACQRWNNLELGTMAFEQAVKLDNTTATAYACMANIYATAGLQEDAKQAQSLTENIFA